MKKYLTHATDFLNEFKMFILALFGVIGTIALGIDDYVAWMEKHGQSFIHSMMYLGLCMFLLGIIFGGVLFLRCYVKKTNKTNELLEKIAEGKGCKAK